MGGCPLHGTGPGGFPIPGGSATDVEAATLEVGREMVVHLGRGGNRGGGVRADGYLHSAKVECGRAVYCDMTDSGPVRCGGEESGGRG